MFLLLLRLLLRVVLIHAELEKGPTLINTPSVFAFGVEQETQEIVTTVTKEQYEQAIERLHLLQEMIAEEKTETPLDEVMIGRLEKSETALELIIRDYHYIFNPKPKPEICRLCNGKPYNINAIDVDCPECGNALVMSRPLEGLVNWKVPQGTPVALKKDAVPEVF